MTIDRVLNAISGILIVLGIVLLILLAVNVAGHSRALQAVIETTTTTASETPEEPATMGSWTA